jgi:acyl-CoA synthetase (AMP-forming)/AMP-acid ligase II
VTLLVGPILQRAAELAPRSVAASLDVESVTFADAHGGANRVAHVLGGIGIAPGDRIASWTDISLSSLEVFFAAARLGAAFAPLNPAYSPSEARDVMTYLRPRLLISDPAHVEHAAEMARQLDIPLAVSGARGRKVPGLDLDAETQRASGDNLDQPAPAADRAHVIFLTSGSTGRPKGVLLSHYASWMRAVPLGAAARLVAPGGGGDLCPFPLFHMAGWNAVLCAWALLRPIHLVSEPTGERLVAMAEQWRPSTLYCIPALWRRMFDWMPGHDLSSLRYAITGTSLISEDLLRDIKERLPGTETTISYGSTEMGIVTTLGDQDLFRKLGSIGRPNPGFDAAIIDGELCLAGETVMSGYFDLPAETAAVFDGGWYKSGDLAVMDDEGYLTITGRRREIIRSGGETIAPSEVEAALAGFPGVRDVGVVGLPDESWGEVVCAVLVLEPGTPTPSVEAIRAYVGTRLANFKHPRAVTCVDALPRTAATGQIQRSHLRATLLAGPDGA